MNRTAAATTTVTTALARDAEATIAITATAAALVIYMRFALRIQEKYVYLLCSRLSILDVYGPVLLLGYRKIGIPFLLDYHNTLSTPKK